MSRIIRCDFCSLEITGAHRAAGRAIINLPNDVESTLVIEGADVCKECEAAAVRALNSRVRNAAESMRPLRGDGSQ